jgi:hypothetical protein
MVAATALKTTASRSPSIGWPPYWISQNLPIGLKVDGVTHTQDSDPPSKGIFHISKRVW